MTRLKLTPQGDTVCNPYTILMGHGMYYMTRAGDVVGPMRPRQANYTYSMTDGTHCYTILGRRDIYRETMGDVVARAPDPFIHDGEPEQVIRQSGRHMEHPTTQVVEMKQRNVPNDMTLTYVYPQGTAYDDHDSDLYDAPDYTVGH